MAPIPVDIWSDIACPWCWVGKRHLELAAEQAGLTLDVTWRAFELNPAASRKLAEDVDYVGRLARKYRASREGAQQMIDRMVEAGARVGLDFRFDRARPTNTFDAHRLLAWARDAGDQDALAERLFVAYMSEGRDVADPEVLVELADDCGLDGESARAALATDAFSDEVRAEEREAAQLGVTGVPFFVFARRYAIGGAHPPAQLREVLERVRDELAVAPAAGAPVCGPDGCEI